MTARDQAVREIAERVLHIDTLDTRHRDSLDFHDRAVWTIREALEAAYDAGRAAASPDRAKLLRAVVDAAIAYVADDSGESDASGLDAGERLSEALVALGDTARPDADRAAWRRLTPAERAVVTAAWRGCCGTLADEPIGTDRAGLDNAVARLVGERKKNCQNRARSRV